MASAGPDRRVLPAVGKLLRLRVRLFVNGIRRSKGRARVGAIIVGLLLAAFAGFLLFLSWLILDFLRSPDLADVLSVDPEQIFATIPVLILTGLFIAVLLTSFGGLLQALYLTGDMDFLMAAPVPIRAVFIAKLVQAVAPVFALVSFFGLPILIGLGLSGGYNPLYYPLLLLAMVALSLAASGLASLLVMLVVRVMPPRRAAEIVAFFGAIIGISFSQIGNIANAMGGPDEGPSGAQVSGFLLLASTPWFPLNWAGRGLVELGEGRWLTGIPLVALTLGLALGAFWVAVRLAERWYYTGWAGMQVVARRAKPARGRRAATGAAAGVEGAAATVAAATGSGVTGSVGAPVTASAAAGRAPLLARWLPQPVWAMIWRDALVLRRDLRNLSQLVTPLVLGVIYTVLLFRGGRSTPGGIDADGLPDPVRLLLAYSNVGMSLFVGWMLLGRLAGTAFSREGRSYWLTKASPVGPGQQLAAKFIVAYVPAMLLAAAFNIVIAIVRGMAPGEFAYSLVASLLCLAGMTGILLAFGVLGANFTWDDPRRMAGGTMGCLGQILAMAYVPLAFGLFIGPVAISAWLRLPDVEGYAVGLVLGAALALTAAILPPLSVRDRVMRLDESA